jgi:hypothetical protein
MSDGSEEPEYLFRLFCYTLLRYIINLQVLCSRNEWQVYAFNCYAKALLMHFLRLLAALAALLFSCHGTSDGLTDAVTWDQYSLAVNGSRVFVLYVHTLGAWYLLTVS